MWLMEEEGNDRRFGYFEFGIQRSGTTLVDATIRKHYNYWKANDHINFKKDPYSPPPQPETMVWKHAIDFPLNFEKGSPVVLVYKNPYTWAESMAFRKGLGNGAWNTSWGHENLNLYPQPKPGWNNISVPGQGVTNIGQIMYVLKHWCDTWLAYAKEYPDSTVIVKYEDFIQDDKRQEIFREMEQKFGWEKCEENIDLLAHVGSSQPITPEHIQYYLDGKPVDERFYRHGPRYIQSINDILGRELIEELGYEFL
jgi:hypothetical protein